MIIPSFDKFMTLDWKGIEPLYLALEELELNQDTLEFWMKGWSDLRKLIDERYARLSLATELDTTDQEAEDAFHDFIENIYPSAQAGDQKLKEILLESKWVPPGMELILKKMRTEADLFCEENLPLMTKESKLSTAYSKILGGQTIEWKGEELTLTQAKSKLQTPDREERRKLWELMSQAQLKDRKEINDLWFPIKMSHVTFDGFYQMIKPSLF